jgi:ADP-ribose pyrophosphatase
MLIKRSTLYRGRVVALHLDTVRLPTGAQCELEVIEHPGGAAVVAVDGEGRICLLRQYRYAAGGWIWELPAGKLEQGEAPGVTAQRELLEEAGVRAKRLESLGTILSSPGVFTEVIHLFLALDLESAQQQHEAHEAIEVHWMPIAQAYTLAVTGEIGDAKTLAGLLRAHNRLFPGIPLAP